jgi:hypothetical protein
MEVGIIVGGIILLLILYFIFGMLIKFVWGWFPLILGIPVGISLGIIGDWTGAIIGLVICIGALLGTDSWQGSLLFLKYEELIEKQFYLDD